MAKRDIQWVIGWREWIGLPDFDVEAIKAKIDTGARTSSMHAFEMRRFRTGGRRMVEFSIHPLQRSARGARTVRAEVIEDRKVRSSNGDVEVRPTIVVRARIQDRVWPIELTLTNRDEMGFRLLLGREAVRRRFLVDPGRSFLAGRPPATE